MSSRHGRSGRATLLVAATISVIAFGGGRAGAEVAPPTPQVTAADAQFLAFAPAPPDSGAACFVDTGLRPNADTTAVVLHSEALDPAQTADDTGADLHGSLGVMTAFGPVNGWGTVGLFPAGRAVTINALPPGQQSFPFSEYQTAIGRCVSLATVYPIRVISLALSASTAPSSTDLSRLRDAVYQAHARGISVVAAAGNGGGAVEWPAALPGVLAVGAADQSGALCSFSARGAGLGILAPGCPAEAAAPDTGQPVLVSGTSTSDAEIVAADLALRDFRPDLTWDAVEQLLETTAHNGNLDVAAAFRAAGLADVVEEGEAAAASAQATAPVAAVGQPAPGAGGTTSHVAPRRRLPAWPVPRVRWRRDGARLRVVLRAMPRGARAEILVQRAVRRGTVRTVARRIIHTAGAAFRVLPRGRIELNVRYLADHSHAQSRVLRASVP